MIVKYDNEYIYECTRWFLLIWCALYIVSKIWCFLLIVQVKHIFVVHASTNVCMYGGVHEILWRGMTCSVCTVWQVAGSSTLSYCKGRVPYLVSGMKIYTSVQEEGDCASIAITGSVVKSVASPLQQGHTDRQTDRQIQVSDTGTHRQTDSPCQGTLTLPEHHTPGEQARMYVLRIYELSTNEYVYLNGWGSVRVLVRLRLSRLNR